MSIASELTNLENNIGDAYDAVNDMSGIIPQHKNMANLDQAIRTIPQSQGATYTAGNGINIDANNEISVDTSVVATQTDLAGKQDTLTAGSNMTISNNVISAKVDSALSASSANPVQNSVVKAALDGKNKTIWTAYNLSPAANTPASWKTLLGGDGIYLTWYDTANKFTNQPGTYGFLMTIISGSDIRQEWWMQTSGKHYYRTGNGKGWYAQSSNVGVFMYLGNGLDTSLSTTSNNPVQNKVVTNALNDKANSADLATVATSGSYNDLSNKPTIVAGTINVGSMGAGRSEQTVSIPTQANANYVVLLSLGGAMSGGWTKISLSVASKTISSFTMVNYNEAGYAVNNVLIDYLVIPR